MEYTQIEYIGSGGSQYIDTGIIPDPDSTVSVTFSMSLLTTAYDTVFGTRDGDTGRFTARFDNSATGYLQFQRSRSSTSSYQYNNAPISKVSCLAGWTTVQLAAAAESANGVVIGNFSASLNRAPFPYPIFLFALNDGGNPADFAYIRIQSAKIWDSSGVLQRDYIAARDGSGTVGLYDKVTDSFAYNSGDGQFSAGPDLTKTDMQWFQQGFVAGKASKGILKLRYRDRAGISASAVMAAMQDFSLGSAVVPVGFGASLTASATITPDASETIDVSAVPPTELEYTTLDASGTMAANDEFGLSEGSIPQGMGYTAAVTATMEVEENG